MLSNKGGDLQNQTYNCTIEMLSLILSCTFDNATKTRFSVRKIRLAVAFAANQGVGRSVLLPEIVKVGLQDSQSGTARLT